MSPQYLDFAGLLMGKRQASVMVPSLATKYKNPYTALNSIHDIVRKWPMILVNQGARDFHKMEHFGEYRVLSDHDF